jgi:hypothetical protein
MATLCPTILVPEAWEERGETTIQITFRRSTGGAMGKRDQAEGDLWPKCCLSYSVIELIQQLEKR